MTLYARVLVFLLSADVTLAPASRNAHFSRLIESESSSENSESSDVRTPRNVKQSSTNVQSCVRIMLPISVLSGVFYLVGLLGKHSSYHYNRGLVEVSHAIDLRAPENLPVISHTNFSTLFGGGDAAIAGPPPSRRDMMERQWQEQLELWEEYGRSKKDTIANIKRQRRGELDKQERRRKRLEVRTLKTAHQNELKQLKSEEQKKLKELDNARTLKLNDLKALTQSSLKFRKQFMSASEISWWKYRYKEDVERLKADNEEQRTKDINESKARIREFREKQQKEMADAKEYQRDPNVLTHREIDEMKVFDTAAYVRLDEEKENYKEKWNKLRASHQEDLKQLSEAWAKFRKL